MRRGEVWQCELGGAAGRRPVLILTRSAVIPYARKVTVGEITTKGKGYPTEVFLDRQANLPRESFAQLDGLHTVAKDRLRRLYGTLDEVTMLEVGRKLVLALELEGVSVP